METIYLLEWWDPDLKHWTLEMRPAATHKGGAELNAEAMLVAGLHGTRVRVVTFTRTAAEEVTRV